MANSGPWTVYCPRCNRSFTNIYSKLRAYAALRRHAAKHEDPQQILDQLED